MNKYLRYGILGIVLAAIPVAVIWLNIHAFGKYSPIQHLEKTGIEGMARVVERESTEGTRASSYDLKVHYLPSGAKDSLTADLSVDQTTYGMSPPGALVPIKYDSQQPEHLIVPGDQGYFQSILYAIGGDVLLVILLIGVFRIYRKSKRQ